MNLLTSESVPPYPKGVENKGLWTVLIPATSTRLYAGDFLGLTNSAREHLIANGQPVPNRLEDWLGELICSQLGKPWRGCSGNGGLRASLTLNDVGNWLKTMIAFAKSPEFVSQEQAEARAAVCAQCPNNVALSMCATCKGIAGLVTTLGRRETSKDGLLANCSVCGCYSQASVHYTLAALDKASHGAEFPEWCWHRTESTAQSLPANRSP